MIGMMRGFPSYWVGAFLLLVGAELCLGRPYIPTHLFASSDPSPQAIAAKECKRFWGVNKRQAEDNPFGHFYTEADSTPYLFKTRLGETLKERHQRYRKFYDNFKRQQCWKEWLVLVYMAGDNDLSPFLYRNLKQMETIGSTVSVDIVTFTDDQDQTDGVRYYHIAKHKSRDPDKSFWTEYREDILEFASKNNLEEERLSKKEKEYLWEHGPEIVLSPAVRMFPERDSGKLKTARRFVIWALKRYPARRIMLMGWSHGEGFAMNRLEWLDEMERKLERRSKARKGKTRNRALNSSNSAPSPLPLRQGGFAFDFTSDSHMPIPELARGLRSIVARYRGGNPIDILGSDACLMQQLEVGIEVSDVADYIFGSATVLQARGSNYGSLLRMLTKNPKGIRSLKGKTKNIAKEIVKLYGRTVKTKGDYLRRGFYDPDATMAVWKADKLPFLRWAIEDIGTYLVRWILEPNEVKERIKRRNRLKQQVLESPENYRFRGISNDLQRFLLILEQWAALERREVPKESAEAQHWFELTGHIDGAKRSLKESVLAKYIGDEYKLKEPWKESQGVAIWLPLFEDEFEEMFPHFSKGSLLYQMVSGNEENLLVPSNWALFIESLYANRQRLEAMERPL